MAMNFLPSVLTQKIANDFLRDCEAVAFGSTTHEKLRHLLGYRIKCRIDYQILADGASKCARLCEMDRDFVQHRTFNANRDYRIVARSQPLEENLSTAVGPHSLAFARVDHVASSIYRIGSPVHIRIARSDEPRSTISEIIRSRYCYGYRHDRALDSEDEEAEDRYYAQHEEDDGRIGRPELAHFDFLPSTVRHLEISNTVLLSPTVTMSTLHRLESLTLGALWSWQLTPTTASSYWPPQLKSLEWNRWFQPEDDDDDHEYEDDGQSRTRFFSSIEICAITFPSTLTELKLPRNMYQLFDEKESKQLNAIQYPQGLLKLIRPFIPLTLSDWRLPESIMHLECDLFRPVHHSQWNFPIHLRTLIFSGRLGKDINLIKLPLSLTSFTLPNHVYDSFESMTLPASLTEFNCNRLCIIPLNLSHTSLRSFTVCQVNHPLATYKLPPSVTRIDFSPSECLPQVPSSYVWPSELREVHLKTNFWLFANGPEPIFHLPHTLRHLFIRTEMRCSPAQLTLPEGLESIDINLTNAPHSLHELVLPSTLKEFIYTGVGTQLPQFSHTQLTKLDLSEWNHSINVGEFLLPETVRSIRIGGEFNQPLDHLQLPAGLTELRFGDKFSQSLTPISSQMSQLTSLRSLALGTSFTHLSSLMDLSLPTSLRELVLPTPETQALLTSPFHTRYTDFVTRIQDRGTMVTLITHTKGK